MKKRFSKVLSVLLSVFMLAAMVSVAFAADAVITGSGTETDPYLISDAAGLAELAANVSTYDGKYIALAGNITLNNGVLTPIGTADAPFKGYFDGCGYTLSQYTINGADASGLFAYTKDAVVKNVSFNSVKLSCSACTNVGLAVGYAEDTQISGVKTDNCVIEAGANAGGIVGTCKGGSVTDCVNGSSVALNKNANAGGIVGNAEGADILRCINKGAVNARKRQNAGGIVGNLIGTVSHCLNTGAVSSTFTNYNSHTAGIAGAASGTIGYCGNTGKITSTKTDCSGIFGAADDLTVSYCYNAGEVACNEYWEDESDTIGIGGTVAHCIGVGGDVTADALKTKDAYEGWDFDTVWYEPANYHGYAYPVLRDCSFHKMSVTEQPATCTKGSVEVHKCDLLCGFTYNVTKDDALGHDWVEDQVVPASCTYEGEKTFKCSRCEEPKPEKEILPIDPDAHVDADGDNICDLCEQTIKQEEAKRSFFQKIGDFFRRIFDWIKNLFKRK